MRIRGVKFKAYPTAHQKQVLSQWMGCARVIYNAKCDEERYFRTFRNHSLSLTGARIPIDQSYAQFKSEKTAWLKKCPSQILRNSAVRWYDGYQRFLEGKAGRPRPKSKEGRQSIWLTKELFCLEAVDGEWRLFIGSTRNNIGYLSFHAHRDFQLPHSIVISRERGEYYVSFSYEAGGLLDAWEQTAPYIQQGETALQQVTEGCDRGVARKLQSSSGVHYDLDENQKKRLRAEQKKMKRHQKRMNRQQKGSKRRKKIKRRYAKAQAKQANIRHDFAHKTSRKLVEEESQIFVMEALSTRNMTRRPAPKQDESGKYLPNQATAKAGLNRSILESVWGKILRFLAYKAQDYGKLVIVLPPYHSSQECAQCHHTHPDNRQSQSEFLCRECGHTENADKNASDIMKYRGVQALLSHPKDHWEETSKGNGIWKIKNTPAGTRGSARGGAVRRSLAQSKTQPQRSVNRVVV